MKIPEQAPIFTLVRFSEIVDTYHSTPLECDIDGARILEKHQPEQVRKVWPWAFIAIDGTIADKIDNDFDMLLGCSVSFASDYFQTYLPTDSDEEFNN